MDGDADIQVWLETFGNTQPSVIVPYIQTQKDLSVDYSVQTVNKGNFGRSTTSQSGNVYALAKEATELSRFSLSRSAGDLCNITITLTQLGKNKTEYKFDCPE